MCIKLLTRASTLDMFCHIKIIWKLNEWVQFLFVSCFPVYKKTTLINKYMDMGQVIQSWGQIIQGYFEIWFLIWKV